MPKDNRENILLDYAFISLISSKIDVIIIGGGNSGYIKAKSFFQKGYNVSVVSKQFDEKFKTIEKFMMLIVDEYKVDYILDKHLVIVATDDKETNKIIIDDCEKYYKIYLNSIDFKKGQIVTPVETKTENIRVGVHTSVGSPKTSLFLGEKINDTILEYDDFVSYIGTLRNDILKKSKSRTFNLEVMDFVNSDDFYFFYKKNKHRLVLKLFWRDDFDF